LIVVCYIIAYLNISSKYLKNNEQEYGQFILLTSSHQTNLYVTHLHIQIYYAHTPFAFIIHNEFNEFNEFKELNKYNELNELNEFY